MSDPIFLRLNDKFALGADELQWILFRKHSAEPEPDCSIGWRGISYVRSTKAILLRCMREAGCKPSPQAQVALESLPTTFDAWNASLAAQAAAPAPSPSIAKAVLAQGALENAFCEVENVLRGGIREAAE